MKKDWESQTLAMPSNILYCKIFYLRTSDVPSSYAMLGQFHTMTFHLAFSVKSAKSDGERNESYNGEPRKFDYRLLIVVFMINLTTFFCCKYISKENWQTKLQTSHDWKVALWMLATLRRDAIRNRMKKSGWKVTRLNNYIIECFSVPHTL